MMPAPQLMPYKAVGSDFLKVHVFRGNRSIKESLPAFVFYHGGGWNIGTPAQFYPFCEYFAALGMRTISVEYRLAHKHGTTPLESVEDARFALQWIVQHAAEFGIDPYHIVAGGGSAGGHLAACTAIRTAGAPVPADDGQPIVPRALVLFNPVLDTSEKGFHPERFAGRCDEFSPCNQVFHGFPPTLLFHGTSDTTIPFGQSVAFRDIMHEHGNICELVPFEGHEHGFFNFGRNENKPFYETIDKTEQFLKSLGII